MHTEVLPETSGELLATLTSRGTTEFHGWVLAGGTGLALQLGHRISEDFDFFCTREVDTVALFDRLREVATCETLYSDEHTLTVLVDGVKLSFFQVRDPFLFAATPFSFFGVADLRDIGLMKLLPRKYGPGRLNPYQVATSLTYFDDAEAEPLPRMLEPFEWSACKEFFIREVRALVLP